METRRERRRERGSRRRFASAALLLAVPVALGCELDRISGVEDFGEFGGVRNPVPEEVAEELGGELGDDEMVESRGSNGKDKERDRDKPYPEHR